MQRPPEPDPQRPAGQNPDLTELIGTATVFALPMVQRFRSITVREGILLRGPRGWAEFAPFANYDDAQCVPWLEAAVEAATVGWPEPVRDLVPVNTTVPVVSPERATELVTASGCTTAKIKVADPGSLLAEDADRVAAVRQALGSSGRIRVDANAAWSVPEAVEAIRVLDAAAGGLEYVEQPCRTVEELAAVRRLVGVPIAADESIRLAGDPMRVALAGAADIAVVKVAPLGGVAAALRVARATGLAVVISSAVDSAVGLAAGLAAAGALPELPYACGLGTASLLAADVTGAPDLPVNGSLAVPRRAPEPVALADHLADDDTRQRWLDRLNRVAGLLARRSAASGAE
ncbi:O-succinylbenzoate synthase [Nakamurella silvestris]|nr:O-succinylbenzoate synthase [Nakamurella silvestris]